MPLVGDVISGSTVAAAVGLRALSGSNGYLTAQTVTLGNLNGLSFYTSNGSLVGSYTAPSTAFPVFSAGTSSASLASIVFSNSNGVSFGLNGSTITGSHNALTTARGSTDAVGLATALTANGVAWTVNSAGLSLNVPAFLTTARGSTDAIGLNTAKTNATWTVNSAGISFDGGAYLTTARGSTDAIGLNTAKSNVTWTVNSSGVSFDAAGYAGTGTTMTGASATLNSNGLQLNVPAIQTLTLNFAPWDFLGDSAASTTGSISQLRLEHFTLPAYLSFGQVNLIGSASVPTSSVVNTWSVRLTNSTQALLYSAVYTITNDNLVDLYLFSRGSGGFSSELETFASTRNSFRTIYNATYSASATLTNTAGGSIKASQQISMSISYPMITSGTQTSVNANSTFTTWGTGYTTWTSTASNSSSDTISTSAAKSVSVASTYPATTIWATSKMVVLNFGTSLTPGEYWLGMVRYTSSSSSSTFGSSVTGAAGAGASYSVTYNAGNLTQTAQITWYGQTGSFDSKIGFLGFATQATMGADLGHGSFSGTWDKATTYLNNAGNPAGAIAITDIKSDISYHSAWFQFASNRI